MYLIDTDVLSAGARSKSAHPELTDWIDRNSDLLSISAMTVAEIEAGIAKLRRDRSTGKADALAAWLDTVIQAYGDRVLAFDLPVARIAGDFMDAAKARGRLPGIPDVIIAATASFHRLTLLTRNLRHFAPLGVPAHDPFLRLPGDG